MYRKLLFVLSFLLVTHALQAQVTLTGTSYAETFDGVGTSLPSSWSIYTGATSTTLGNTATYVSAATAWTSTTGNFRNVASGDIGTGSNNTQQNAATDRAIAIRQTGSLGDPGAAFAVKLANTTGFQDFKLSLKLQSLDASSARSTTWAIQYGLGNSPTSFTTVATQAIGGSTFTNNTVNYEFGFALDNIGQNVWIRVVALTASTGSGSRATTGLDDFSLTYSALSNNPRIAVSATSLPAMVYTVGQTPTSTTFTTAGKNLNPATPIVVTPPANYEVSTDANSGYTTSPLALTPAGDGSVNQTVYTRLASGLSSGAYSGTVTVATTEVAGAKSIAVSGNVYPSSGSGPCGISTAISAVRGAADNVTFTVTGRVTSNIGTNMYIQDATGGLLLYTGSGTTIEIPEVSIGDEVQVTGVITTYRTDRELQQFTGCFVKTTSSSITPTSTTVTGTTVCDHKGELVTLPSVTISAPAGTAFTGGANYTLVGTSTVLRIQNGTDLVNATRPSGSFDLTGVVSLFDNVCQILPRSTADVPGSTPTAASCPEVGTGGSGTAVTATLDVAWWNVEWLGNTGFGPTNEAQQQSNVAAQLQTMNKDIYCLEEICDLTKLDAIVATLNAGTGKSYTYTCGADPSRPSPRPAIYYSHWFDSPEVPGDATTYAQKVCFVYDQAVVTNVSATQIVPASLTDAGSSDWASNRFPVLMNCDVTINGIKKNLKLVGVHAKSGSDNSSYSRRIADFNSLRTYLDTNYPNDNIMIMGDYNDDVDQSIYIDAATSATNVTSFSALSTSANYTVVTKQLSNCNVPSTASYPDIIDHLTVSNEISTNGTFTASGIQYITNSVNNVRPVTGGTTTSDHYPVTARFLLAAPDLTPTLDLPQANFNTNTTNNFAAYITEVGGNLPTTGNTIITITAPTGYTIGFDNTISSINVTDGTTNLAVDNTKWSVTNNVSNIQLTLTLAVGQSIGVSGKSTLGFSLTRTTANSGSTSSVTVNVSNDATQAYDSNITNNVYSRIISGL
ncbi:DUF5689 domain-containing protein [Spirosoma foliorum]|uniref:DUF5689 domain-containing protein n=1 Tax=Spirosoma foliorum TaxID=2710596 RepID=A0A7G5GV74_9BACT|nr:DUF5689 domain-containing protein [Spirosoma foliorum]QMW02766.1 hypothetical protein H3H32_33530 [Spirosoma foliorum]